MTVELRVRGLAKRFGARVVLDGADLSVDGGETVALLGENGSGKSTVLRVLAGLLSADAGSATLDGESLVTPARSARRRVGWVSEAGDPFPYLTAGELLDVVAALKRCARPDPALVERLGVARLRGQRLASLSLGQRQRTCLLAALLGSPALLLLDEPTNGLDADGVKLLAALLAEHRAAGGATLLATHDTHFAEAAGARTLRIDGGRIVPAQRAMEG